RAIEGGAGSSAKGRSRTAALGEAPEVVAFSEEAASLGGGAVDAAVGAAGGSSPVGLVSSVPACWASPGETQARWASDRPQVTGAAHRSGVRFTFATALGSIDDAKIRELARVAAPAGVDAIDARRARPFLGPPEQLADGKLFPLCQDLDRAVGTIPDPAAQPQPARLPLRGGAEVDALDASPDEQLQLLQSHGSPC